MSEELSVRSEALEPLFAAWEEPNRHRVRARTGEGAEVLAGRRPSPRSIAQNLRAEVKQWRDSFYFGASDTSRHLLNHWFSNAHTADSNGDGAEFRYYFCQREAIETLIYLKEVRRLERLSQVVEAFGGQHAEIAALGITDEEDAWSRYCFKMATGSGKTKVMSLAIVWSYFHALRESDSPMTRHFVAVTPNLTVFERLKEDFKPEGGGPDIFDRDPLIPTEWRGDWNLSVVLQDEASGATTGGTLYLTNIHRLYDTSKRKKGGEENYGWVGPTVSKAKALDTGAELRDRITGHERIMILNDEAHHVWDPDSAWNEAVRGLADTIRKRSGGELVAQLDFSATPKDDKGQYFKHIVCDTPLGEAVDGGIVKTPIIGRAGKLVEQATDNSAYRYEQHLMLGYKRWLKSKDEWQKSGKKPLMFVMCNDTKAADEIAARLNGDDMFRELNNRTINLHTNLKGKIKKVGGEPVFVESEKEISDDDLKALRRLSRELDSGTSPYFCIVSVLMLREGWDVRNVTTIVPLRPYSSQAGILPEQTLGRGLRRMTPTGQANEVVAVVEHDAFARLYREELAQEGLPIEVVEVESVPATTISIFPDPEHKDVVALEIDVPRLSAGARTLPVLGPVAEAEIRDAFKPFKRLPLTEKGAEEVQYEGRHLITGEVIEHMKVSLSLLASGVGAISFFEQEIEYVCKVRNTHTVLGPLLQLFFEKILFEREGSIYDKTLVARLSDGDVREHVRAVFVPLVRRKTTQTTVRSPDAQPIHLSDWRPYQVTVSERRPVRQSLRTLFNLVPCNRALEVAFAELCARADDVAAFAKNAGPQCLRVDYLSEGSRLAFYTPDFFIRTGKGSHYLVETKGQVDRDVPIKARAAMEWCKAASNKKTAWEYLYVPEDTFKRFSSNSIAELARMCAPALHDLVHREATAERYPLFAHLEPPTGSVSAEYGDIIDPKLLEGAPERLQKAVDEAVSLYRFFERKPGTNLAPVFASMLGTIDDLSRSLILQRLTPKMPGPMVAQRDWFDPDYYRIDDRTIAYYKAVARNLQKTLIYRTGMSPIGLLRNCFDYALGEDAKLAGVFEAIRDTFQFPGATELNHLVQEVNKFRNTRIAHQEKALTDVQEAKTALAGWINTALALWKTSKAGVKS